MVSAVEVRRTSDATIGTFADAGNANPDLNFRYDATIGTGGGYIFNMSTKALTPGKYELRIEAGL